MNMKLKAGLTVGGVGFVAFMVWGITADMTETHVSTCYRVVAEKYVQPGGSLLGSYPFTELALDNGIVWETDAATWAKQGDKVCVRYKPSNGPPGNGDFVSNSELKP